MKPSEGIMKVIAMYNRKYRSAYGFINKFPLSKSIFRYHVAYKDLKIFVIPQENIYFSLLYGLPTHEDCLNTAQGMS